jgi:hypothetical protein
MKDQARQWRAAIFPIPGVRHAGLSIEEVSIHRRWRFVCRWLDGHLARSGDHRRATPRHRTVRWSLFTVEDFGAAVDRCLPETKNVTKDSSSLPIPFLVDAASIVIPVFNEEENIEPLTKSVPCWRR